MSAPTLASRNGDTGCFTDTAAEPFGLSLEDQDRSAAVSARGAGRAFDAGPVIRVAASTLSRLQSSSKFLISASLLPASFLSASLASGAAASAAAASGSSPDGTACALACAARNMLTPAATINSKPRSYNFL